MGFTVLGKSELKYWASHVLGYTVTAMEIFINTVLSTYMISFRA